MLDKNDMESRKERIELHCHSKLGGNATMHAGEALRFAGMRGMPALAITDTGNMLSFSDLESVLERRDDVARPIYGMHLLTTEEMLDVFSYLPDRKARESVIDNTYKIAYMCEKVCARPMENHYPILKDADERLRILCEKALHSKYDAADLDEARRWMECELACLERTDMAFHILLTRELMEKARLRACDVSTRGMCSGSIVLYLLDVTEIDPLKYHLSTETIYGYDGARRIDIDVNVPAELQNMVQGMMNSLEGIGTVVRAGTIKTISHHQITEWIDQYEQYGHLCLEPEEEGTRAAWY